MAPDAASGASEAVPAGRPSVDSTVSGAEAGSSTSGRRRSSVGHDRVALPVSGQSQCTGAVRAVVGPARPVTGRASGDVTVPVGRTARSAPAGSAFSSG